MKSFVHFAGNISAQFLFKILFLILISIVAHAQNSDILGGVYGGGHYDEPDIDHPAPPGLLTRIDGSQLTITEKILFGTSVVATYYLVSQTKNGPLIFGGLYAMGTLLVMRESNYKNSDNSYDLAIPFAMITMSVLNIALLNNSSSYSYNDIFTYNLVGTGLIAAFAYWDHIGRLPSGRRRPESQILPFVRENQTGLAWLKTF